MKRMSIAGAVSVTIALALLPARATSSDQKMEDCPMHAQHQKSAQSDQHSHELADRGMGFSQEKTTHHFVLARDGGKIQVTANSATDRATIDQVQSHLSHIARAFRAGDFAIPMLVHGRSPDGVPTMQKLKSQISYAYEGRPDGAAVVIRSRNPEAVAAVQQFLRFQIREHRTGDPLN
jgi:hypothetical protein